MSRRAAPGIALLGLALFGCLADTEGTGKGTGKEFGGCYDGVFCDPGLECLLGVCILDDDQNETAGSGNQAVDTDHGEDDDNGGDATDGGDTTGDGDGDVPPPPSCGDGVLDDDETCDGGQLAGQSCQTLGWDMGGLSCTPSCEFNLSDCRNDPQPGVGKLYSPCLDNDSCPGLSGCATVFAEGEDMAFAGFCSNFCGSDGECAADVGGTANPECNDAAAPFCQLDCSNNRTCPGGMDCIELSSGAFVCY